MLRTGQVLSLEARPKPCGSGYHTASREAHRAMSEII